MDFLFPVCRWRCWGSVRQRMRKLRSCMCRSRNKSQVQLTPQVLQGLRSKSQVNILNRQTFIYVQIFSLVLKRTWPDLARAGGGGWGGCHMDSSNHGMEGKAWWEEVDARDCVKRGWGVFAEEGKSSGVATEFPSTSRQADLCTPCRLLEPKTLLF